MAADNELTKLYGTYGDAELQELAGDIGDLTEPAQQALRAEFSKRGLALPVTVAADAKGAAAGDSDLESFAANASEECTFQFTALEDAILAQSVLKSAGIESLVPSSEISAIDGPRVIVSPADAQSARLILARPNALGTLTAEEAMFLGPTCPECGAVDPVLESVEPTNEWRCEACGHLWQDAELA